MKFNGLCVLSLLLVCSLNLDSAEGTKALQPMPEFDKNQFSGLWYAIKTSWPLCQCLVYEFTNKLEEFSGKGKTTGSLRDKDEQPEIFINHFLGTLIPDPKTPSTMCLLSEGSDKKGTFVVLATDYKKYAVVYSQHDSNHVTILSRTQDLDETNIKEVKESIRLTDFDMNKLKKVDHSGCKHDYKEFEENKSIYQNAVNGDKNFYIYATVQTNYVLERKPT